MQKKISNMVIQNLEEAKAAYERALTKRSVTKNAYSQASTVSTKSSRKLLKLEHKKAEIKLKLRDIELRIARLEAKNYLKQQFESGVAPEVRILALLGKNEKTSNANNIEVLIVENKPNKANKSAEKTSAPEEKVRAKPGRKPGFKATPVVAVEAPVEKVRAKPGRKPGFKAAPVVAVEAPVEKVRAKPGRKPGFKAAPVEAPVSVTEEKVPAKRGRKPGVKTENAEAQAPKVKAVKVSKVEKPAEEASAKRFRRTSAEAAAIATAKEQAYRNQLAGGDDFNIIEGMGEKTTLIAHAAGIKTFKQLANTPLETLSALLKAKRIFLVKPTYWAEQAQMIVEGRTDDLRELQARLKGNKIR
jgi:predicted flap endonuclease-1-like 5' DNA nuclease